MAQTQAQKQRGLLEVHEAIEEELKESPPAVAGLGIVDRIAVAQGLIRRVEKRGLVTGGGTYTYATASDVYDMVRPILSACGIAYTVGMAGKPEEVPSGSETSNGKTITRYRVPMIVTLECDGGKREYEWHGVADDHSDKGQAKAITLGLKSWLMAVFQISSEDMDAEVTDSRPSYRAGTATQQAPPPNTKAEADALRTQAMQTLRRITAEIGTERAAHVLLYLSQGREQVRDVPADALPGLLTSLQAYDRQKERRDEFDALVADYIATRDVVAPPPTVAPETPTEGPAQGSFGG